MRANDQAEADVFAWAVHVARTEQREIRGDVSVGDRASRISLRSIRATLACDRRRHLLQGSQQVIAKKIFKWMGLARRSN